MGKLGVGVGEDFPMDDGKPRDTESEAEWQKAREEWRKAHDEWHKQREEWREKRRELRDKWKKFRDQFRAEMRERYSARYEGWDHHWGWDDGRIVVGLIAILGLVALTILIFSHFTLFLGLLVLGGLWFAWRGGFDHHFEDHIDHRFPQTGNGSPPADAPKA